MNLMQAVISNYTTFFPNAPRRTAKRQAVKLIKAKRYLAEKGIYCIVNGNRFEYKAATGSVLK